MAKIDDTEINDPLGLILYDLVKLRKAIGEDLRMSRAPGAKDLTTKVDDILDHAEKDIIETRNNLVRTASTAIFKKYFPPEEVSHYLLMARGLFRPSKENLR